MNNIILQHWTGPVSELTRLSSEHFKRYAKKHGADYLLVRGNAFKENFSGPMQKLIMLDEQFDPYDMVVMLDPDMFERKGMGLNVFTDVEGVGMYASIQRTLHHKAAAMHPMACSLDSPYWGGAIYRLSRELRQKLRAQLVHSELARFTTSGRFEDEGSMNYLANKAGIRVSDPIFNGYPYLPDEYKWCHCSYREGIEDAAFIHIRTKIKQGGPKQDKMLNYQALVDRGIIEE